MKGVIEETVYGSDEFTSYMQRYAKNGSNYQMKQNRADETLRKLDAYPTKIKANQKVYIHDTENIVTDKKGNRYYGSINGPQVYGGGSDALHYFKSLTTAQLMEIIAKEGLKETDFQGNGKYGLTTGNKSYISIDGIYDAETDTFKADANDVKEYINTIYDYKTALEEANAAQEELNSGRGGLAKTLGETQPQLVNAIKQYSELFGQVHQLDSEGAYKTNAQGEYLYANDATQDKFADIINNILKTAPANLEGNEVTIYLQNALSKAIDNIDDEAIKKQLENSLKEIESNLERTGSYTWVGIKDSLDRYTASLKTANTALEEITENGAMASETFDDLAQSLDNLSLEDVYNSFGADQIEEATQYVDGLINAMKNLQFGYDENTGAVKANADALEYVRDAQEKAAKGKIKSMIQDLAATKASSEMQVGYIDAQIAAIDSMIRYLGAESTQAVDTNIMMADADTEYAKVFGDVTDKTTTGYEDITGASAKWAETTVYNIAGVTEAWSEYWKAVRNGDSNANDLLARAKGAAGGYFKGSDGKSAADNFKKATGIDLSGINGLSSSNEKVVAKRQELESYLQGLRLAREKYAKNVSLAETQISYLEGLFNSDLSHYGSSSSKENKTNITTYIGKLEEIYNVLRKIEGVEQRLSNIDAFMKIARGADYAKYALEKVSDTQEQYALNIERIAQQKFREQ